MTRLALSLAAIALSLPREIEAAPTSVVYDSLANAEGTQGFGHSSEIGQAIVLESNFRQISRIDLWLASGVMEGFRVRFYKIDGPNRTPGTLIWESPVSEYPFTPGSWNEKIVSVEVPVVTVPVSFAWIVAPVTPDNGRFGILASALPAVGYAGPTWNRRAGDWVETSFDAFGARVHAVPEPSTSWLGVIVALTCVARISPRR